MIKYDTIYIYQFLKYISEARKSAGNSNALSKWSYFAFFAIAYYTGMRKWKINALKWSDIYDNIIHLSVRLLKK